MPGWEVSCTRPDSILGQVVLATVGFRQEAAFLKNLVRTHDGPSRLRS